jgi:hypothetical protein
MKERYLPKPPVAPGFNAQAQLELSHAARLEEEAIRQAATEAALAAKAVPGTGSGWDDAIVRRLASIEDRLTQLEQRGQ